MHARRIVDIEEGKLVKLENQVGFLISACLKKAHKYRSNFSSKKDKARIKI